MLDYVLYLYKNKDHILWSVHRSETTTWSQIKSQITANQQKSTQIKVFKVEKSREGWILGAEQQVCSI